VWNFEHQESGSLKTGASELKRSYIYGEYKRSDETKVHWTNRQLYIFLWKWELEWQ